MSNLNPIDILKCVKIKHPGSLPHRNENHFMSALVALVYHSGNHINVRHNIHASMHHLLQIRWICSLIPCIEKLAVKHHIGNYVLVRETHERLFETMPIYARIGMHLLFYGKGRAKLLGNHAIELLLDEQTVKEGKICDSPQSVAFIPSFIATYSIRTDELLQPDIKEYKCFNDFFYRRLRPDARPVQNADDPTGACSAADCRLTVYQSVDLAAEFWVKGKNFNIPNLLNLPPTSEKVKAFENASLAIFRLAPADYHRFHSPIDGIVGDIDYIPGQYYSVNPQVVNEPGFDVFTANRRSVLYLTHATTGLPVAYIAIGALLVGSIRWTGGGEKGKEVKRGEELGYFAYGGSTIVAVFAQGIINFDEDLIINSRQPIETLMKVGNSLGKLPLK